jgi:hypothetical protein
MRVNKRNIKMGKWEGEEVYLRKKKRQIGVEKSNSKFVRKKSKTHKDAVIKTLLRLS